MGGGVREKTQVQCFSMKFWPKRKIYFHLTNVFNKIDWIWKFSKRSQVKIYKNCSSIDNSHNRTIGSTDNQLYYAQSTQIVDLDATDYIELYGMHEEGGSQDTNYSHVFLSGYKLIGV